MLRLTRRCLGANERVRAGLIGIGLIGKRHLLDFMAQPDVDIAAICETYEPRLEEGVSTSGGKAERFKDFRRDAGSQGHRCRGGLDS